MALVRIVLVIAFGVMLSHVHVTLDTWEFWVFLLIGVAIDINSRVEAVAECP